MERDVGKSWMWQHPIARNVTIYGVMPLELVKSFRVNVCVVMATRVRGVYWRDSISTRACARPRRSIHESAE